MGFGPRFLYVCCRVYYSVVSFGLVWIYDFDLKGFVYTFDGL